MCFVRSGQTVADSNRTLHFETSAELIWRSGVEHKLPVGVLLSPSDLSRNGRGRTVIYVHEMNGLFDIASPLLYLTIGSAMIVFVAFGVWSLQQRFRRYEEWALRTQVVVLLAVFAFYTLEIKALRLLLVGEPVYFMFALLGLAAAGFALYGHILVSLLSRLMVEAVVPDNPAQYGIPRLGPAEILEHDEDWEGALNEYYVLARVYPNNALIYGRIANNLLRLERHGEAVKWLERSLEATEHPRDALVLLRRLWDTHAQLGEHQDARDAVLAFTRRFPDFEASALLLRQLGMEREAGETDKEGPETGPAGLEPLEAHPLNESTVKTTPPPRTAKSRDTSLEVMEDDGEFLSKG